VSSPCFEFGVALRTGQISGSLSIARPESPIPTSTSNDALRNRQVKRSFFRPGHEAFFRSEAHVAKSS
jgi:hypothetical protein